MEVDLAMPAIKISFKADTARGKCQCERIQDNGISEPYLSYGAFDAPLHMRTWIISSAEWIVWATWISSWDSYASVGRNSGDIIMSLSRG